jgi:hypothetical protein
MPDPGYYLDPSNWDPWEAAAWRLRQGVMPEAGRQEGGASRFAGNARDALARGAYGMLAFPSQVIQQGGATEDMIPWATNMAMLMVGSPGVRAPAAPPLARETVASRSPRMYNPPAKPPRPFEADYPSGAPADASGRLTHDIEGRPLGAEFIAGRRMVGGSDQPLGPSDVVGIATRATGREPAMVTPRQFGDEIGGSLGGGGRLVKDIDRRSGAADYRLFVDSRLPTESAGKVTSHEVGHLIDDLSGRIPTAGLNTELRQVYNTLNTSRERTRHLTGPQHLGYRGDEIPRELTAEAIRAYLADPNYIKTVAPRTAAAIRAAVNAHPTLSKIIQLNTIAGPAAMVGIDPDALPIPRQEAPVFSPSGR